MDQSLTVLLTYTLKGSAEEFTSAITRLAERVRRDGHPGLNAYRFFVNERDQSARAVVDYASSEAWVGHHDIAMAWPEMKAMHQAAALTDITFLGDASAEVRQWLSGSSLSARLHDGYQFAAGFRR
jgi:hypothetical protein